MLFSVSIIDEDALIARVTHGTQTWDISLASGYWSADDYRAHWGFTSYALMDYWRTKFLILEARPTGSAKSCRAFRVSRIADRFHFHDVLIKAPATIGGYSGESLIEWLSKPETPYLESGRPGHGPNRTDYIEEFIVEHDDFQRWHYDDLDNQMPDQHRSVEELTTRGDCA